MQQANGQVAAAQQPAGQPQPAALSGQGLYAPRSSLTPQQQQHQAAADDFELVIDSALPSTYTSTYVAGPPRGSQAAAAPEGDDVRPLLLCDAVGC